MLKRSRLVYGATVVAMLGCGSPLFAQESANEADGLFAKLDKNNDGKLTKDEVPEEQVRFFERLVRLGDKDKDGTLTKDEFQQANKPEEKSNTPLGPGGEGSGGRGGDARQRFQMLDRNKDGKVSLEEVPEQFRERMKPFFDRLGKTELSAEEFAQLPGPGGQRPDPKEAFKQFDKNGDGKLTREELPEFLRERAGAIFDQLGKTELTEEEWVRAAGRFMAQGGPDGGRPDPKEMFKQFDKNNDGKLSRDELPERLRERMGRVFERLGKEELTSEEWAQASDQMRRDFEARPGQSPEGRRPEGTRPTEGTRAVEGNQRPDQPRREEGRPPLGNPEEMFARFDANGDGKVTVDEVPERAKPILTQALRRAGKDADGSLTKEEFLKNVPTPSRGGDGPRRPEGERRPADGRRPEGERGPETRRPDAERGSDARRGDGDQRPAGDRPEGRRPEGRGVDGDRRPEGPRGPVLLRKLDQNNDGRLSKDELARLMDLFEELDTNHDGLLDPAELIGGPMGPPRDGDGPRGGNRRPEGDRPADRRADGDRRPEGERDQPRDRE